MLYITLRQYEYLDAIAREGSLTGAAEALNVSQPSLSVAISRIEDVVGKQIFIRRKGTSLQTTPFGHQFLKRARKILTLASELERGEPSSGSFKLGCFEDLAPIYLVSTLDRLNSSFPEVTFRGTERQFSELAIDLTEGRLDLAISFDIGFPVALQSRLITTMSPVVFCAPDHPLAKNSQIELDELVEHEIILFAENLSQTFVLNLLKERDLSVNVIERVNSLEMMRALAANGRGIGISYSNPPGKFSYDGKPVMAIPVSTQQAAAEIRLFWSALREHDEQFERIRDLLAPPMETD